MGRQVSWHIQSWENTQREVGLPGTPSPGKTQICTLTKRRKNSTTVYSPSEENDEVPEEELGARAGFPKGHPTLLWDVDLLQQPRGKRHFVDARCTCNDDLSLRHATLAHQPAGRLWHQPWGRRGGGTPLVVNALGGGKVPW